jgi:hypothetical protein
MAHAFAAAPLSRSTQTSTAREHNVTGVVLAKHEVVHVGAAGVAAMHQVVRANPQM